MATRLPFLFEVQGSRWLYDLAAYHAAANAVAHGASPYQPSVLASYADAAIAHVFAYVYTPVLAIVLQPAAPLGMAWLQPLWILVSSVGAALLVVAMIAGIPFTPVNRIEWSSTYNARHGLFALALIALLPIHYSLLSGQVEIVAVLLFILALLFHHRHQPVIAGVILGAMLATKHAAVLMLPLFLLSSPRSTVLYAVATGVAIYGLTVIMGYGYLWADFASWFATMSYETALAHGLDPHNPYNISIGSALVRMGLRSNEWFTVPGLLIWLVTIATAAGSWFWRTASLAAIYAAVSLASVLALPFAWTHHLLYVAPALVISVVEQGSEPRLRRLSIALLCVLQCAPGMPFIRFLQTFGLDPISDAHALSVAFALTAVLVALLIYLVRLPRGSERLGTS
jgi:alpha-1,2-mannosyltransferase